MPGPAVYVLAIVGTVAAGLAFKEFIYEPHLAPKLEQWAENFIEKRRARRREKERQREAPIAIPLTSILPIPEERLRQRRPEWRTSASTASHSVDGASRTSMASDTGMLDEPNASLPYTPMVPILPMSPVHIISSSSNPSTPSTDPFSTSPFRDPNPLPSPPSTHTSPTRSPYSGSQVPSLSTLHPISDHEIAEDHDVELLSAPSTASSIFSSPLTEYSLHVSESDANSRPESRVGNENVVHSPASAFSVISDLNLHPLSPSNVSDSTGPFYSMSGTVTSRTHSRAGSASSDDDGSEISDISWSGPAIRHFD